MDEELFPYQLEGIEWLKTRRFGLLADPMGMGKSAQAIVASDHISRPLNRPIRILVLAPAVARHNWKREFEKFSANTHNIALILDSKAPAPNDITICSYDILQAPNVFQALKYIRWDLIILDEVHYLKSTDSKRSHLVWGKNGICRHTERVWALSGTPAPNHAGELWTMLYSFGRTKLSYLQFITRFCHIRQTDWGPKVTGTRISAIPELKSILEPVMLRRNKDILMLPPIIYHTIVVPREEIDLETSSSFVQYTFPYDRTKELYDKIVQEELFIKGIIDRLGVRGDNGMKALELAAKSVSTLRRYTGLQKLQAAVDWIKGELEAGAYQKVVVFAIHQDVIEGLRRGLREFNPVTIYGGTPPEKKDTNIEKFKSNPKCRVFIGNIQAAGISINLTHCHNVIFVEQEWVPALMAQAAMRCHRIGQVEKVTVRFFCLADSIDEKISDLVRRKTRELTLLLDSPELAKEFASFDWKELANVQAPHPVKKKKGRLSIHEQRDRLRLKHKLGNGSIFD